MAVWALGLNHITAPLDLRGRFAFAVEQLGPVLSALLSKMQEPTEATILSTCNRTEIYCAAQHAGLDQTLAWLAHSGGVSVEALRRHTYLLENEQAARHAFRVASGLDSMVLGEPQILGQMKEAVRVARDVGALGTTLGQMFERSFSVAKHVRSETEIGAHSISMAAAAVRLASQLFENLSEQKILFVGAGEMIALCAAHFNAKKPASITIANRSRERAELLAKSCNAKTIALAELPDRLHEFDIVVSCTASTLPLIGLGAVESALKLRKHRPMFMVDLAVPRDIEPEVRHLNDIYLYCVDDLSSIVQTGLANRQAAVAQAEVIIDSGVQSFLHWLERRHSVPLIRELSARTEHWREVEIARALKQLDKGEGVQSVLDSLTKSLTQKILHGALSELKSTDPQARELAQRSIELFFLNGSR